MRLSSIERPIERTPPGQHKKTTCETRLNLAPSPWSSFDLLKMSVRHRLISEYKPDAPARVTLRPLTCAAGLYFHQPGLPRSSGEEGKKKSQAI